MIFIKVKKNSVKEKTESDPNLYSSSPINVKKCSYMF